MFLVAVINHRNVQIAVKLSVMQTKPWGRDNAALYLLVKWCIVCVFVCVCVCECFILSGTQIQCLLHNRALINYQLTISSFCHFVRLPPAHILLLSISSDLRLNSVHFEHSHSHSLFMECGMLMQFKWLFANCCCWFARWPPCGVARLLFPDSPLWVLFLFVQF